MKQQLESLIVREARLLDQRLLDDWLALYTDDATYWVPIDEHADPLANSSVIYDDRTRLAMRVEQIMRQHRVAQQPASETLHLVSNIDIDAIDGDTAYVIAVNANLPVRTLAELGAYARANPTKVFNGAGAGGQLLVFESFGLAQNFKAQHINYRGEAPALTALAAGDVQASVVTIPGIKSFLESGRVRALAIPSPVRSPSAPGIPTAEESGVKNFNVDFWFGLMAPAGTAADIRKTVHDDVAAFLARPETQRRFVQLGLVAKSSTPEEFGRLIELETQRWVEVVKRAGIQPE